MNTKYKTKYKIISILAIIITLINITGISRANLVGEEVEISIGWLMDIPYSYNNEERKAATRSTNTNIPVYVMKKNNGSSLFTTSDIQLYENEIIKNILKNGYGCKTLEELGNQSRIETFLATQEAIYITLEGRNIDDYVVVEEEERANRILGLARKILEDASKEKEDKIELIENTNNWQDYEQDNKYKYKEYTIKSTNQDAGNIIIESGNNVKIIDKTTQNTKQNFMNGDSFYLLAPKKVSQDVKIKFSFEKEDAILYKYSRTEDLKEQYLLAENGMKTVQTYLQENIVLQSTVEILNKDKETKIPIQGNEFTILGEDNQVVKENLITGEDGKIDITLNQGTYYLKQSLAVEGYDVNKALIEINVESGEQITINIESTKVITEEVTNVNKEINVIEENKNVVENNVTEVSNITTTNINKEIINQTNETNLNNVNNFINTTNRKNVTNLQKENTYKNTIEEIYITDRVLEGENRTLNMTRQDYVNYIDLIMLNSARVPVLPVASK